MSKKSEIVWLGINDGIQTKINEMNAKGYELISIDADVWEKYDSINDDHGTVVTKYMLHFKQAFLVQTYDEPERNSKEAKIQ